MPHPDLSEQIVAAMGAHGAWKLKLKTAIGLGRAEVAPEDVACHTCCQFGKWLEGDSLDGPTKAGKPYQVVHRLHREFHQVAAEVMRLATEGDPDAAKALLDGEYAERTAKLSRALTKWKGELH